MPKFPPLFSYLLMTLFVLSWWTLAFKEKKSLVIHQKAKEVTSKIPTMPLSSLSREMMTRALNGDLNTILHLLQEWETDADLLEMNGRDVKRLPKEQVLRALSIGRHLLHSKEESNNRFLPQTYAATSIMLALSSHENIVAIPKGIRELTALFPKTLTDQIPLNAERDFSEKLYQKKPDLALVSSYSQPATLEAFRNQGIDLLILPSLETIDDIIATIGYLGDVTHHPLKGELLQVFVKSAFFAIDNRLIELSPKKVLFLQHMNNLSLPTRKTLTGQLLTRLNIPFWGPEILLTEKTNDWSIPLSMEQIANHNPDCLIISTADPRSVREKFQSEKGFQHLPKNLNLVDEAVQTFPSQFIALAYYDLATALLEGGNL